MLSLDLALFGGFAAAVSGEPMTQFHTDKGRALLAYPALNPDRPLIGLNTLTGDVCTTNLVAGSINFYHLCSPSL